MTILLKKLRAGFPQVHEPKAIGAGAPAYGIRLIVDPKDPQIDLIEAEIEQVAKDKWGSKADTILAKLRRENLVAFSRKKYLNKDDEVYDGFEGMYHIGCRNAEKKPPTIFDAANEEVTNAREIEKLIYPGCYVHPKIEFWAQDDPEYGRRINCNILGLRFAGNGKRFAGGGGTATKDDFADLEVDDDDLPDGF